MAGSEIMVRYQLLVPRNAEYDEKVIAKIRELLEAKTGVPVWLVLTNQGWL